MAKIKVTVTMPAYNAERYIREAIESVLSQDYDKFELLILDDGSKDKTFDIIKRYKNHPNVRIYKNGRNQGVGRARNKLLRLARGRYISPCDADDIMLPENLKTLSGYLDSNQSVGVVYGNRLVLETDNKGNIVKPPFIIGQDCSKKWDLIEKFSLISHPGSMVRRELMLRVGGYDETVYSIDDVSLWLKLIEITHFKYLKDGIYYLWRRHPESLTKTVTRKRSNADRIKVKKEAIKRRYNFDFEFS